MTDEALEREWQHLRFAMQAQKESIEDFTEGIRELHQALHGDSTAITPQYILKRIKDLALDVEELRREVNKTHPARIDRGIEHLEKKTTWLKEQLEKAAVEIRKLKGQDPENKTTSE